MDDQSKWFLEMETPPSKEAVKIVEMTRYDLEFYINPIDKAVAGFERIDSGFERTEFNFERISTMGKMLPNSTACKRRTVPKKKSQSIPQTSLLFYSKKLPQPPQPSATTTLMSQQPPTLM